MTVADPAPRPYAWVRHLLPRVVIGALIAAALVGVYAVIIGQFDQTCWRLIGTIALLVLFSLTSWYDADVSARRASWFGAVSVGTSAYLLLFGLWKIWFATDGGFGTIDELVSWILLVAVTRLGLLHIHLVLNTQRKFTGPIMSKVTIATLILVGLLVIGLSFPLIFRHYDFSEMYWRTVGIIAILDALGTILIPLTYSLFGPKVARVTYAPVPPVAPPVASQPTPTAAPPTAAPWTPPSAYPRLDSSDGLRLEWPRYINGQPLPAKPDGSPDFAGVIGY